MNIRFFDKIWSILKSSYLCMRFPFLYPRNRFSGRHYTNWNLREKYTSIYRKWSEFSGMHQKEYYHRFGAECIDWNTTLSSSFVKAGYVMKLATFKDRFLYFWYKFCERFLGIFHFLPEYTELDGMPSGWRKRFGIDFCKELKRAILHSGGRKYMKEFRILDIKEKYGTLRCYACGETDEVMRVIRKYEYISQYVCIVCGEDAVKCTTGWISPYCEKCLPETNRWVWIDPVYGWSNGLKSEENKKKHLGQGGQERK